MVSPDPDATTSAQTFENVAALDPAAAVVAAGDSSSNGQIGTTQLSLQSVTDLLRSIEEEEEPTLHYLHLLLPHGPYVYLPDGRRYTGGPGDRPKASGTPAAGATRSPRWPSPSSACFFKPCRPTV